MKALHFSKKYFNTLLFEDVDKKLKVKIRETPSIEIDREEYSLRITTRFEDIKIIHRDYAIEHHMLPNKHYFPHLQFKFNADEIGQFRIRIDINDIDDYKKAILGFIYKIKSILTDLERFRLGLTAEILVLDLVNELEEHSKFLDGKIRDGIIKYKIEFDEKCGAKDKLSKLSKNPLLLDFLGKDNLQMLSKG